jgi:hypothetical protein
MNTNNQSTRIVAFKIGRGGRFNNSGHRKFLGERSIGDFTEDLFVRWTNEGQFKDRYGYSFCRTDEHQKCIQDLITDGEFEELEEKFGITQEMLGEQAYYCGASLNPVGLTMEESDSGIGCIDIDGEYNTVYCKYLDDCTEEEVELIRDSGEWNAEELVEEYYAKTEN